MALLPEYKQLMDLLSPRLQSRRANKHRASLRRRVATAARPRAFLSPLLPSYCLSGVIRSYAFLSSALERRLTSVALFIFLPRSARARIVAAGFGRLIPHRWILQLVAGHKFPVAIFTFKQTLFAVVTVFPVLRKPRLEGHQRSVFIDDLCLEDLQSAPRRRLRPLAYKVEIDLFARARMSGGNDEVDRVGDKSRIACAHQLLGCLTLTRSVNYWLATAGKVRTGTTRADLIVFSH